LAGAVRLFLAEGLAADAGFVLDAGRGAAGLAAVGGAVVVCPVCAEGDCARAAETANAPANSPARLGRRRTAPIKFALLVCTCLLFF
jgi:hypothetical protein